MEWLINNSGIIACGTFMVISILFLIVMIPSEWPR